MSIFLNFIAQSKLTTYTFETENGTSLRKRHNVVPFVKFRNDCSYFT